MRRLMLFALAGSLALSACSNDDTATGPTTPAPEAKINLKCRPAPFPIYSLTLQTIKIFPVQGGLQAKALISEVAIGVLWTVCKPTDAQNGVAAFVKWTVQQFQANKLIGGKNPGSGQRVSGLIDALYAAVGLIPPGFSPEALGDGNNFGNGLFVPGTQTVIKTGNSEGATLIPPNGFDQPTLITIFLKQTSGFTTPPQPIFAPFYEITASNADGTHYLTSGQFAVVGFCADATLLEGLGDPAIAHDAVAEGEGNPGGFEVLDDASTSQYNSLGLACPRSPDRLGALDMGSFKGFAMSAWRRAAHYAGPVAVAVLLPHELQATTAMVTGKSGLGGLARSLSPFAVTDRGSSGYTLSFGYDPGGQTFFVGESGEAHISWDTCNDGCDDGPRVFLKNGDNPITDEDVHVELEYVGDTDAGAFSGGSTTATTDEGGVAIFDQLFLDPQGPVGCYNTPTYKLKFTAPNAQPLESGTFTLTTGC